MDIQALIAPLVEFFSHGIGKIIADIMQALYNALFPANAPAATTTPTVETE